MENASKALLMAAGVLIALMITTLMIYTFANFGNFNINFEKQREEQEVQKENNKFYKNLNQKLTAQEVVTVINMVKEYNSKNDTNIKIFIGDTEYREGTIDFIQNNLSKNIVTIENEGGIEFEKTKVTSQKFLCKKIEYDDTSEKITEIHFQKEE